MQRGTTTGPLLDDMAPLCILEKTPPSPSGGYGMLDLVSREHGMGSETQGDLVTCCALIWVFFTNRSTPEVVRPVVADTVSTPGRGLWGYRTTENSSCCMSWKESLMTNWSLQQHLYTQTLLLFVDHLLIRRQVA